jgi:hypothetical protein
MRYKFSHLILTKEQRKALKDVYDRTQTFDHPLDMSYREFRRTIFPGPGCIMVPFAGMVVGIEPDGYTHS